MAQRADNALKMINRAKIQDKRKFTIPPPEKLHIILVKYFFLNYGGRKQLLCLIFFNTETSFNTEKIVYFDQPAS